MKALNLDENLRRDITEFFISTNATQVLQRELEDFMKKRISQTYRIESYAAYRYSMRQ